MAHSMVAVQAQPTQSGLATLYKSTKQPKQYWNVEYISVDDDGVNLPPSQN